MALTLSEVKKSKFLNEKVIISDITFDSSYATGGESLTPAQFGLVSIDLVLAETASGYMFQYDYTNSKLKAFYPRAAITDTLAISAHAAGATPVTSDAATMAAHTLSGVAGVAAGAGAEVTATTNLSSVVVRIIVIGH